MASQTICIALLAIYALTISSCTAILCNPHCPKIYKPVCAQGTHGRMKTFNNLCLMEYESCMDRISNWRFVKDGECGNSELRATDTCPLICPLIYAPVCGVNNYGIKRVFGNNCQLQATQCTDRAAGWKILSQGQCNMDDFQLEDCPTFCTFEYSPVCGEDQTGNVKTFGNLCSFKMEQCSNRAAGWKIIAETECIQPLAEKPKCSNVCTDDYSPVCGVSNTGVFKTFANKCMFEMEDCNNRDAGWKLFNRGECDLKQTLAEKPKCSNACTDDYSPVCGISNTGVLKTFENKCMFEMEDCNNRDAGWKLFSQGVCNVKRQLLDDEDSRACQGICTKEYRPVCAKDNTGNLKTFPNECVFKFEQCNNRDAGWKIYKHGECSRPTSNVLFNCPMFCPEIYAPVEGVNRLGEHKVFSNKCEYNVAKCLHPTLEWKLIEA